MASITKIPSGAYRVQTRRKGRCGRETFRRRDDAHRWTRQAETRGALPIAGCQRSRTPATLCEITRPNHEYTYRMITRNHLESYANCHHPSSTPKITDLPVFIINDATAGCQAEHLYGRGKQFRDYAYFFVGAFVGGGIVLNNAVYEGRLGNAGALGSLRSVGPNGESRQLVDTASIHTLEARLRQAGYNPITLWNTPQSWTDLADHVTPWLDQTAIELAKASLSTCAVIDFEAIIIDGAFPPAIREELVKKVRRAIETEDTRGLILPVIESGSIGSDARALGAACSPVLSQFMLNNN